MTTQVRLIVVGTLLLTFADSNRVGAQQTLPAPGQDPATLIGVLRSERPAFEKAKACQQLAIMGDDLAVPALAELLSDDRLSAYARTALEQIPGEQSNSALRVACGSLEGNNLRAVIHSLGKQRNKSALPVLAEKLNSNDLLTCVVAARAIGEIGTSESVDLLKQAISDAPAELQLELGQSSLICIQRLIGRGAKKDAIEMCRWINESGLPNDIKLAATYQKILAQGDRGSIELLRMFAASDRDQFEMALYAARRLGQDLNMSVELASMLRSLDPDRQVLMLAMLADLGDKRILPTILPLAKSGQVDARVEALQTIARIGDESCIPVIRQSSTAADLPVANAAVAAAIAIKVDQMDSETLEMLESDNEREVKAAIVIAAGRKLASAADQLDHLRRHQNEQIRKGAIYAIGQTATADQLGELVEMMISLNDDDSFSDVQQALKSACLRMPQEDCARTLSAALVDAPDRSKASLMDQLALVGGPLALQTVVSAAKSGNQSNVDAATRVLGQWLTADAASEIFELAQSFPQGNYRTRLLRGYIRVARQLSMTMGERMEVCRNALQIAERNEEKLLVLDVLRRHRSREGLAIAETLVNEKGLTGKVRNVISAIRADISDEQDGDEQKTDGREVGFVSLFDGKTLNGWKGGDIAFWRVVDGAIVGGDLVNKVKQNEFLRSTKQYADFELRLQFKLIGDKANAGVQIRTAEITDHHEVIGYQADLGDGWWGCLYDESRRRKVLAGPPPAQRDKPVRKGEWNDYRILCEGKRIQLWINGTKTVDYTEKDPEIPQTGIIALQVHGNQIMEAQYRNIRIKTMR